MTSNSLSESSQFEFVPLTPLEESFEDDSSPLDTTTHSADRTTAPSLTIAPSLSIVTCESETSTMMMDHVTLSSCDDNKMAATAAAELGHYTRPLIPSLVDPALHGKYSRYLNGSFDSSVGYTTTDVTSDCGSVATHPLVVKTHKMTKGVIKPGHKRTNGVTQTVHKIADSATQTARKDESHTRAHNVPQVAHKGYQTERDRQQMMELDLLWKQFLVSPLYTEWVEPKGSPDPSEPCKKPTCYCEELKQLEHKAKYHAAIPVKPPMVDTSTYTGSDTTYSDNSTLVNTAVQTSPSLLRDTLSTKSSSRYMLSDESSGAMLNDCPCVSSHVIRGSPPSSDTSTSDQVSHDHCIDQPASLTTLSLQEACRMFKGDFISNCLQRQKLILHTRRKREEDEVVNRHQAALVGSVRDQKRSTSHHHHHTVSTTGKAVPSQQPKMTPREMHHQSKRLWRTLPEVKQKQNEVKKKAAAAVNRMNMKLYQQRVLHDLRKKRI